MRGFDEDAQQPQSWIACEALTALAGDETAGVSQPMPPNNVRLVAAEALS